MSVGEFCNREVIVADTQTSVMEVAQLMRTHHVGSLVIVEPNNGVNIPTGIITDRDIVIELVAQRVDIGSVCAGDVMSTDLLIVREVDGLWETIKRMRSRGVRRVPVVNDEKVLVGILSADDILEILANEFNELVTITTRERRKEESARTVP